MVKIGYARVSTFDQHLDTQVASLQSAGCSVIRSEKISGKSMSGRKELELILEFIRPGDTLVVTRIDRLARSVRDLQNIIHELKAKGADLLITEQSINTRSSEGNAFIAMLGVFAEFENNLRRERQAEGIARAKEKGRYKGRKTVITTDLINAVRERMREPGNKSAIARDLGISRTTLYRALKSIEYK